MAPAASGSRYLLTRLHGTKIYVSLQLLCISLVLTLGPRGPRQSFLYVTPLHMFKGVYPNQCSRSFLEASYYVAPGPPHIRGAPSVHSLPTCGIPKEHDALGRRVPTRREGESGSLLLELELMERGLGPRGAALPPQSQPPSACLRAVVFWDPRNRISHSSHSYKQRKRLWKSRLWT